MNEKARTARRTGTPAAGKLFERAVALHRENKLDEAEPLYRDYLRVAPKNGHAWTNLGALLRKRGLHAQSIAAHRRALQVVPGLESARNNLSNALADHGYFEEAAQRAIADGHNQYARMAGAPVLVRAVAETVEARYGLSYDPLTEVVVTCGATEAIHVALMALTEPGDEVVMLEPYYDSYRACTAMSARATPCHASAVTSSW